MRAEEWLGRSFVPTACKTSPDTDQVRQWSSNNMNKLAVTIIAASLAFPA
jgi:hypothetical protein